MGVQTGLMDEIHRYLRAVKNGVLLDVYSIG